MALGSRWTSFSSTCLSQLPKFSTSATPDWIFHRAEARQSQRSTCSPAQRLLQQASCFHPWATQTSGRQTAVNTTSKVSVQSKGGYVCIKSIYLFVDSWNERPVTSCNQIRRRAVVDIDRTVPPQGWMCSPVFEGERSVPSLACLANHVSNMQMLQFQHWPHCITPIIRSLGDNNPNTKQSFKTIELKEFCAARAAAVHNSAQWCAWCWHRAFSLGQTHVEK